MPAQQKFFLGTAAFLGALAVILGAFGAHGLENRVPPERLETFETGVRYHMYHAIAMLVVACAVPVLWKDPWAAAACWAWLVGILIFSGSLYTLTLTGLRWLGAITPIGGVAFVLGWGFLVAASARLTST